MGKRNRRSSREFRATTALKRTALLAVAMAAVVSLAYSTRVAWSDLLGWDVGVASDMLMVAAFFIGSLIGTGVLMAAIEVHRNGERLRWQDSASIEPPTEPLV